MLDAVEKLGAVPPIAGSPRRRWSEAKKQRIVAERDQSGTSGAVMAQRNDVNANLLFNWRHLVRERAWLH